MTDRIDILHKVSLYVIVGLSFLSVAIPGAVGPVVGIIFVVGMAASWVTDAQNTFSPESGKWWNVIILLFIAGTLAQVILTGEPVLDAAIRFVMLLIVIKLFGRFEPRDDLQLYALSLLAFAAATAVHQGVSYGILFGVYVLAGTLSLALFHLSIEKRQHKRGLGSRQTPFNRQYAGVLALLSVAIFASSLLIFFTFPRVGLGFFVQKSRDQVSVTGFSETVELGSHGVMRSDPEVVMRVEFPGGRPQDFQGFHWRTMTLDRYDGRRWHQTRDDSERPLGHSRGAYRPREEVPESMSTDKREVPGGMQIYLEPIGSNLLPRLWPTESVRLGDSENPIPIGPNSGSVTVDDYGDLRHTIESEVGVPFRLTVGKRPDAEALRKIEPSGLDPELRRTYLQLPDTSQRFRDLAEDLTEGEETPYAKAEAIRDYLEDEFEYTTNLPQVDQRAPVESFLFDTQKGHCEYFATAGVLLLREAGVPARLVNGFLGGKWNGVGDYLAVRQGDAHSWIEVYLPRVGWVPLDPTPAADVLPQQAGPLVQWYRDTYDAIRLVWFKWVIEYDLESQLELLRSAGNYLAPKGLMQDSSETSGGGEDDSVPTRRVLFWTGLAFMLAAAFWGGRRNLRRRYFGRILVAVVSPASAALWICWFEGFSAQNGVIGAVAGLASFAAGLVSGAQAGKTRLAELRRIFARVEAAAAKNGVERKPSEGPGALLTRLADARPDQARLLGQFKRRYLRARFGTDDVEADEVDRLRKAASRLAKSLK